MEHQLIIFFSSGMIGKNRESLVAFLADFDEPISNNNISLIDVNRATSDKINRKVGFENIEYKEVIVKSQTSGNSVEEKAKWKIGLLNNFEEALSYSSFTQAYLGFYATPEILMIFGGSFRSKSKKVSNGSSGYGLNLGLRKEFFKKWFAQVIYERNLITYERPKPYDHLNFKGRVNDASIGLGRVIPITRSLGSVFTGIWNPFYRQSKSLQSTQFALRVGIEIRNGKPSN